MDADGNFVIAWHSFAQDGDGYGIYARRFAADGTPQGSEFLVNTTTANSQRSPDVALDADSDFVITWHSFEDGDDYGIYAQRYAADGSPQDSEFLVNGTTANSQRFPSVAVDADGDFVIAWQSVFQDGDLYGVYAQRFEGEPADSDSDGVFDAADNCTQKPNPDQRDTNNDGFGNVCDPDLDNSGLVNNTDFVLMRAMFYSNNADADLNGDGLVNFADLAILKSLFNQPPGPSGIAP